MKTINYLLSFVFISFVFFACSESKDSQNETNDTLSTDKTAAIEPVVKVEKASLVYFHYTKRCATCNAIGSISKEVVDSYPNKITYTEYNLDEAEGEEMGKKLSADGQTLMLVYGENKINLTEDAFLNAKSNPEKFKKLLKEKLDAVLL